MATPVKKTPVKKTAKIDACTKIKPRGLWGLFEGRIILNGTDEEVFSLNRLATAR